MSHASDREGTHLDGDARELLDRAVSTLMEREGLDHRHALALLARLCSTCGGGVTEVLSDLLDSTTRGRPTAPATV